MFSTPPLPRPEPIPLPAPAWLLQALLLLTFVLHLLPMAVALGGSALAVIAELIGRRRPAYAGLANQITGLLPLAMPMAITMGVAPLLFVQLLYGTFFYPSTVIIGWPWLSVVALILLAYTGMYAAAWTGRRLLPWRVWIMAGVALMIGAVAYIFTREMTLMLEPGTWMRLYAADPAGLSLPPGGLEPLPRFLHALAAAFALAGGALALYGAAQGAGAGPQAESAGRVLPLPVLEWPRAAHQLGMATLGAALGAQALIGPWYWGVLPGPAQQALSRFTWLLWLGPLLGIGGAVALAVARRPGRTGWAYAGAGALAAAAAVQAVLRHLARQARLEPYLDPAFWQSEPQWVLMGLFLVALAVALATVAVLVTWLRPPAEQQARRSA